MNAEIVSWSALGIAVLAMLACWVQGLMHKRELQRHDTKLAQLEQAAVSKFSSQEQHWREEVKAANLLVQDMSRKITELEKALVEVAERQQHAASHSPENKIYSRAVRMVELGADIEEIMRECELPRAEAELLMSLHAKK